MGIIQLSVHSFGRPMGPDTFIKAKNDNPCCALITSPGINRGIVCLKQRLNNKKRLTYSIN